MPRDGLTDGSPARSAKRSHPRGDTPATKQIAVPKGQAVPGSGAEQTRTKKYYIEHVAERTGVSRSAVKLVLQSLLDEMMDDLAEGRRIEFREFGVFEVKERAQRRAQNPKTLEAVIVPKRRTVKFKPGLGMKRLFDDGAKVVRLVETKPAKTAKAARLDEPERRTRIRDGHAANGALTAEHR